jgi:hypothetical protein
MKRLMFTITLGLVFAAAIVNQHAWGQNADPLNGTWHLNAEKSKFNAGPAIKSQTRVYEVSGDSVKQTVDGVDSQGKPIHSGFVAKYDGSDYPTTGNPDADTISVKRIDAHNAKSVMKKNGKVVQTVMRNVSKDGNTLTMKTQGTNAKGEKIDNVLVFEKQ